MLYFINSSANEPNLIKLNLYKYTSSTNNHLQLLQNFPKVSNLFIFFKKTMSNTKNAYLFDVTIKRAVR